MADIEEYVNRVWERYTGYQESYEDQFRLDLVRASVDRLIKASFYASMIPDEGRQTKVTLMCYRADDDRDHHFPFACSYEVTATNIAKLAHGVSDKGHIYCLSERERLHLNGYNVTVLNDYRHFGYGLDASPNPLKVTIRSPGQIEVSMGGGATIYRAGTIFDEEPLQFAKVAQELVRCMAEEFTGQTNGSIESLEVIVNDLAKAVVRLGHGGMLIFMKSADLSHFSSHRRTHSSLLRDLLIGYWNDVRVERAANAEAIEATQGQALGSTCWNIEMLRVSSDVTMLENCVSSIGHLAGMDGAIVLSYGCNLVGFNAIINRDALGAVPSQLVDWLGRRLTPQAVNDNRGSRHQSAVSFAMRVPNSCVLVISQDGGVSGFLNRGDGTVLCEQGLRVLD